MILPSKHLPPNRALISIGADILCQLNEPRAVSELWECVRTARAGRAGEAPMSFDWFVLALTFLHTIFAVEMRDGVLASTRKSG
jgi:hypothetical protein